MTSLYDCVKAGKYVRDCVKMEKNLRDCVIGHPPWGGLLQVAKHIDCWNDPLARFVTQFLSSRTVDNGDP